MKLASLLAVFLLAANAYALEPATVNKSSHVAAANSTACFSATYLDKLVIGMASSGGALELYSSTATVYMTASTLISSASLATVGHRDFDDTQVKGICYRASSNANGITIIYKR